MNKPTSIIVSIIVIVVALGFVFPSKSHAVSCGDVLGPFGIFKLNGDLNCIQSPALTVREAALLDLNGHAVRCAVPYGEELYAMVEEIEYMVENNMDPEIIAGKVKTMTDWITASFEEGTYVGSIGILVEGTFAVVKNGKVENCDFGVNVEDDEKNTVTNVNAINNAFGISTFSENNWIGFNRAFDNAFGINAFADNNSFKSNSAFGNGFGLAIFNDFNLVLSNIAKNNGFGIFVDGQNNTIKFNTALNNSQDLSDDNTNCDNNLWKYNKFNTRNQSCIR